MTSLRRTFIRHLPACLQPMVPLMSSASWRSRSRLFLLPLVVLHISNVFVRAGNVLSQCTAFCANPPRSQAVSKTNTRNRNKVRGFHDTVASDAPSSRSLSCAAADPERTIDTVLSARVESSCRARVSRGRFVRDTASAAAAVAASLGSVASFAAAPPGRRVDDVKKAIEQDFVSGQYYVTGNLTPALYRPDCLFTDPTTRVQSVDKYVGAVKLLFDPDNARVDLLSLEVKDETHLFAEWRLQGYLKFPWHPYVAPYTGTTLYTLDSDGLICRHEETWSITALDAARATITPTAGPKAARTS